MSGFGKSGRTVASDGTGSVVMRFIATKSDISGEAPPCGVLPVSNRQSVAPRL